MRTMATILPLEAQHDHVSKPEHSLGVPQAAKTNGFARGDWFSEQGPTRNFEPSPLEEDPSPRTILIVDDEPHVRDFVTWTLTQARYGTIEASNTQEARQILQAHSEPLALVICDIRMPGGNGLDFGNHLQAASPGTPILYISGLVDSIVVESLARRDPRIVLTKPFTGPQLLARVGEILGSVSQQSNLAVRPAANGFARRNPKL